MPFNLIYILISPLQCFPQTPIKPVEVMWGSHPRTLSQVKVLEMGQLTIKLEFNHYLTWSTTLHHTGISNVVIKNVDVVLMVIYSVLLCSESTLFCTFNFRMCCSVCPLCVFFLFFYPKVYKDTYTSKKYLEIAISFVVLTVYHNIIKFQLFNE